MTILVMSHTHYSDKERVFIAFGISELIRDNELIKWSIGIEFFENV